MSPTSDQLQELKWWNLQWGTPSGGSQCHPQSERDSLWWQPELPSGWKGVTQVAASSLKGTLSGGSQSYPHSESNSLWWQPELPQSERDSLWWQPESPSAWKELPLVAARVTTVWKGLPLVAASVIHSLKRSQMHSNLNEMNTVHAQLACRRGSSTTLFVAIGACACMGLW
jgi:hypothetical protein